MNENDQLFDMLVDRWSVLD